MFLNLKGKLLSLEKPVIMGILNYTDDSFFDGGNYLSEEKIVERARQILEEGGDIIDLGAVSTRPGAAEVDEQTEIQKIIDALHFILDHFPNAQVSVDTWRASVAQSAVDHGAAMINDISSGTFDTKMLATIGRLKVPYCMMHTSGKPDVMQKMTDYHDLIPEMLRFFGEKIAVLKDYGCNDLIIDPGFGFGKTLEQNYFLMNNMQAFSVFKLPVLVGVSRKSMIYKLLETSPQQALNGTTVLHTIALLQGVNILRVHDVKAAQEVITILDKLKNARS